jgi:DNA-binding NarL/FixJ family response regulator
VTRPPALVVDGDPATAAAEAFPGWDVRTGELPREPFDLSAAGAVWVLTVSAPEDATTLLLAAARGAPTAVALAIDPGASARLLDDLRRVAEVRTNATQPTHVRLGPEHVEVLTAIADGCSLEDAARRLCVSRRTAARRLAGARHALDAPTTVEAVRRARQLGLLAR